MFRAQTYMASPQGPWVPPVAEILDEEFNPAMWIALRDSTGYGSDVDVSTPTAAARFLLSRLQSSAVNRRNPFAQRGPQGINARRHLVLHRRVQLQELRRGVDRAEIYSITFSQTGPDQSSLQDALSRHHEIPISCTSRL